MLMLFLTFAAVEAQSSDYSFTRIKTSEGVVHSILKDRRGFMWFGTQGGLNRYDGYNIKVYNKKNTNGGISHNQVISIIEDKEDILWVGTLEGLNKFNMKKETFTVFHNTGKDVSYAGNNISALCNYNDSLLLAGTFGYMYMFNKNSGVFNIIKHEGSTAPVYIHSFLKLTDGNILVASENGLFLFDVESQTVTSKKNQYDLRHFVGKSFHSVVYLSEEEVIAGFNSGYYLINFRANSFSFVDLSKKINEKDISVRSLLKDSSSNIWIGTTTGLVLYNHTTKEYSVFKTNPSVYSSISSDRISKLLQDESGTLWIATFGGGVSKIKLQKKKFNHFKYSVEKGGLNLNFIMYIFGDDNGNLWFSSLEQGLAFYKSQEKKFYYFYPLRERMVKQNRMINYFAFPYAKNKIVVSDLGYLRSYELTDAMELKQLTAHQASVYLLFSLKNEKGEIWSCDYNGIYKLVANGNGLSISESENKILETPCNFILDDGALIWIASSKDGLISYSKEKKTVQYYRPSDQLTNLSKLNTLYYIHKDDSENLWLGTYSDGLLKFDIRKKVFTSYSTENGLPDNTVYGILEDRNKNLWLSTNKGLSNFIVNENRFINYDKSDGLINEEYNRRSCYKDKNGIMYFGGINGVDYFNPEEIVRNTIVPNIVLTDFKIFNKSFSTGTESSYLKEINMPYDQNSISFQFASLDFTDPAANKYLYKMNGIDEEWIEPGTDRIANYTKLPAGHYLLQVKGSNSDGFWNEKGLALLINISPPFWATWWFRSLVILFFAGSIMLIFKRKTDRLEKEKNIQQQFSQNLILSVENERKRIARELHDGLGQNLLIIKNKAYSSASDELNENIINEVKSIESIAMGSLTEIREIAYNLHPHQIDRLGLTKAIESSLTPLISTGNIKVSYHIDNIDNLVPKEYEINIYRIVQESLNNIIKHSEAKNASVVIINSEGLIKINIEDDGKGFILEEALKKNSLGMASFNERIKILKGTITIDSKIGSGTSIEVKIDSKNFI